MADDGGPGSPSVYPHLNRAATVNDADLAGHGISFNLPDHRNGPREPPIRHTSAPPHKSPYQSPIRHHKRTPSRSRAIKETLNAQSSYGSSDEDGPAVHRINQYTIKQEIGRGSFGAVHLAVDQFGSEFAVKEFSKSRLRKRAQSNLLRKPNAGRQPDHLAAGRGFNSPLHRRITSDRLHPREDGNNSLSLIKEEIAIMKKLNHNNVVSLLEVLDDPDEDSLYMVLEMCKKGVVMKVGLEEQAEPYPEETCRCWFRDLILGIEYLHAQGIVHRDIKPDNCLITDDDVLKIVDFGVSEMFERESDMHTAKSSGSPAFMPPELCVAKHGSVSGRAADIWSMGVTLYCLRYGRIPFEKSNMLDLYESIREDDFSMSDEKNEAFEDLMRRILCKDPNARINMNELREHPWVTRHDTDPLLSAEENCADIVEPPTEAEMDHAITGNMAHLMVVMRAVKRFKNLLFRNHPELRESLLGGSHLVSPPRSIREIGSRALNKILVTEGSKVDPTSNEDLDSVRRAVDQTTIQSPVQIDKHGELEPQAKEERTQAEPPADSSSHPSIAIPERDVSFHTRPGLTFDEHAKGHAHDPLTDTLYLNIGPGQDEEPGQGQAAEAAESCFVSESPPAVDMPIYEQAYQDEMKRILERRKSASVYLTKRVEHREDIRNHTGILDAVRASSYDIMDKIRTHDTGISDAVKSGSRDLVDRISHAQGAGLTDTVKSSSQDVLDKLSSAKESGVSDTVKSSSQDVLDKLSRAKESGVSDTFKSGSQDFKSRIAKVGDSGIAGLVKAAWTTKDSNGSLT